MSNLTTRTHDNEVATQDNAANQQQGLTRERTISPRASVYETPEAVILELEMPGVAKDGIDVRVENDELTVSGRRILPTGDGLELIHQERLPFSYRRAFILSDRIDPGNISAACNNGVLKLTLPKSAEAKPRKITIE
jgi:HSP20 family protein